MRKICKMAGIACLGLLLSTQNSNAQTADFENLILSPESYWDGSDLSGLHNNGEFYSEFTSSDCIFPNLYDTTWGAPGYWLGGFAYSNMTDTITSGVGNQYSARAGSGENSSNYVVSQNNSSIKINNIAGYNAITLSVNNSTYAYNSMRDGDAFAKKFGGPTGDDPDWFKLTIKAYSSGNYLDSLDFYLADFRFSNNSLDYIIKDWSNITLPPTSNPIDSVYFELSSSDTGTWGMNTPGFFCIDNISLSISSNVNELSQADFSLYPNPTTTLLNISNSEVIQSINIIDMNGKNVMNVSTNKTGKIKIDVADLISGVYFIQVTTKNKTQIQKFIKQ